MQVGPFEIALRKKSLQLQPLSGRSGWWSVIHESYMGAWQRNVEVNMDTVLTYAAVYACLRLISTDIGKLCLRLVEQDRHGVWTETESSAFSPVLRKPNRYQTINKYVEQYILSKLIHGNAYVLKQRDLRGVVTALYVLDPTRATPLVSQDGAVYYELKRDDLSGLPTEGPVTVPASEIIHDTMICLYHPLVGVSPLYACGVAAMQGLSIQGNSQKFFANGSNPGGVLTAPGAISNETALRLKAYWETEFTGDNVGKVAVLGDGLKYEGMAVNAVDSQLIEQLKWTAETVCSTFGVPPYLVDIGPPPPYANFEPLLLKYHSQCIQSLTTHFEKHHDEGLGLLPKIEGRQLGTEFDIDDLIWMDTVTRVTSAKTAIEGGGMAPDEARWKYHGLGPVKGGASPMMQQQNYSLDALAQRDQDQPFARTLLPATPSGDDVTPAVQDDDDEDMAASFGSALRQKALEAQLATA